MCVAFTFSFCCRFHLADNNGHPLSVELCRDPLSDQAMASFKWSGIELVPFLHLVLRLTTEEGVSGQCVVELTQMDFSAGAELTFTENLCRNGQPMRIRELCGLGGSPVQCQFTVQLGLNIDGH